MQKSAGTRAVKVSTTGSVRAKLVWKQVDMPAQSGFIYLLLDVAVGHGNGARRPVEEVWVGGDLTRLHWTPCTAQLRPRNRERVKQQ